MEDFNKNQRVEAGQTLLEILLAFSVSILVLSAIIVGITTSLSNTQYTKNQNLANSYAQEGMAIVRQIRDSGWATFTSYASNTAYCLGPSPIGLVPLTLPALNCGVQSPVPAGGIFSREVKFVHQSPDCCPDNTNTCANNVRGSQATVKVSWSDNKCPTGGSPLCHKVELITCFSNLDQKQLP
ncbi:MAG: hypothetical protein HYW62_00145 [Candidatus Levybacteria bacterium]|nr:hypothetical protein [Candidatus Levybacteria bacterium]